MIFKSLVLRNEVKAGECRTPLLPEHVAAFAAQKVKVFVEKSRSRVFGDEEYESGGATLVPEGFWKSVGAESLVLGLKELPEDDEDLRQSHAYFAHCFKGQAGARDLLQRLLRGGGSLYDLEYLVDSEGRRVAAFGYWAGYVGAALAVQAWCHQKTRQSTHRKVGIAAPFGPLSPWNSVDELIRQTENQLDLARISGLEVPAVIVTGHLGRSGRGASDLLRRLGLRYDGWDLAETSRGGPFSEWLKSDILIHCVASRKPEASPSLRPFLTRQEIDLLERKLSVVSDVTCDVGGPLHLLPFYDRLTTLENPVHRLALSDQALLKQPFSSAPLDVIAIDHLPTLLPRESSIEFAGSLFPYLEAVLIGRGERERFHPWESAVSKFQNQQRGIAEA